MHGLFGRRGLPTIGAGLPEVLLVHLVELDEADVRLVDLVVWVLVAPLVLMVNQKPPAELDRSGNLEHIMIFYN